MSSASLANVQIVDDGDMTSDITSVEVELRKPTHCSIECVWTGGTAPTGTLQVQASNSRGYPGAVATWHDVAGASSAVSATPDKVFFDLGQLNAHYVRLSYTATSGDATLNSWIVAKSEG